MEAGTPGGPGRSFLLDVPARPDYLVTARLFVAAVARRAGCDEERVEDAKLAVSEACTDAIHRASPTPIAVVVASDDGGVVVEVRDRGAAEAEAARDAIDGAGFGLIAALFDGAVRLRDGDETVVRFSVATAGAGAS